VRKSLRGRPIATWRNCAIIISDISLHQHDSNRTPGRNASFHSRCSSSHRRIHVGNSCPRISCNLYPPKNCVAEIGCAPSSRTTTLTYAICCDRWSLSIEPGGIFRNSCQEGQPRKSCPNQSQTRKRHSKRPIIKAKNLKPNPCLKRTKGAKYSYGRFVVLENYLSGCAI
jgi:hypothetical protein